MPRNRPHRLRGRNSRGRPPVPRDPAITDQQLAQRMKAAPGIPAEDIMKQRAGIPIEVLATRRDITEPMRLAGEQYGELVHRWRRMHQVPDGTRQKSAGGLGGDLDPAKVAVVNEAMRTATTVLDRCNPMARVTVESICVDEFTGRITDQTSVGDRLRDALREGLTALCGVFRVPSRCAA